MNVLVPLLLSPLTLTPVFQPPTEHEGHAIRPYGDPKIACECHLTHIECAELWVGNGTHS